MSALHVELKQHPLYRRLRHQMGKAVADFAMIQEGDRIAVGLSGGKDSYCLMMLLGELQRRAPVRFELTALTVDAGYPGFDLAAISRFCADNGFCHQVLSTTHYDIIQEKLRPGSSFCSLCARLKRGTLYGAVRQMGYSKLALGHHRDDFIETLLLNQFFVGSIKAMSACMQADSGDVTVIRPLVYVAEQDTTRLAADAGLPVVSCSCPVAGSPDLQRQRMKELLTSLEKDIPHIKNSLLKALSNVHPRHLLDGRLQVIPPVAAAFGDPDALPGKAD
jgi:tRNA 2-thiocytidine biosynthesis protein TtcA